jgi:DNA-binding CsgD family transcriptional regulator
VNTLVGRDRELGLLRDALARAQQGRGSLVLVSGEAGIGKTTLVQAIAAEARAAGSLVLIGQAFDLSATPPYGPWLELADRFLEDPDLPALPEVLKRGTGVGDLANQLALFEVVRDFLQSIARVKPLVLVLEDMHWSDRASLDLLRYMARHTADHRITIITTYRDDEITRQHLLFQLLPLLVRETQPTRVALHRLRDDAVRTLVREAYQLSAADESRLASYLRRHAEGNPLFVNELLRTLEEQSILNRSTDGWQLSSLSQVPVPPLLDQVIEGRLSRLPKETRQLLQVAAVIGSEFSLDIWQALSQVDDEMLNGALEQAIEAYLLVESEDGTGACFTHALIRDALHSSLVLPQRRRLHRLAAELMIERNQTDPDVLAYHFQQAGDPRAVEWLIRSGDRAQQGYAWLTAAERFEAAQSALELNRANLPEQGWLLYRAGRLRRFTDPQRALSLLTEAERITEQVHDPVLAAYTRLDLGFLRILTGHIRQGLDEMVAAVPALDALPADHALSNSQVTRWVADSLPPEASSSSDAQSPDVPVKPINIRIGVVVFWLALVGRMADGLELGREYAAQVAEISDPNAGLRGSIGDTYCGLGFALAMTGSIEDSRDAFRQAVENHQAIGHYRMITADLWHELYSLHLPFHSDSVRERWRRIHDVETAWQMSEHFGAWYSADTPTGATRVPVLYLEGEWDEALQRGQTNTDASPVTGRLRSYQSAFNLAVLGRLLRDRGESVRAWSHVKELLPDGPHTDPGDSYYEIATATQRLAIELALDDEDLETGQSWLNAYDRWLEWSGATAGRAEGAQLWARYYETIGDYDSARTLADRALQYASSPRQPLALITARRFLGELDIANKHYADAAEHLRESLLLAEACAANFERARTILALAELDLNTGKRNSAQQRLLQVRQICEPLGATPTLERVAALETKLGTRYSAAPYGLTPREIDVLRLIARGMSDKEIADALFISPNTVMRHVSHILEKLDVDSRTAATARAIRHGLV